LEQTCCHTDIEVIINRYQASVKQTVESGTQTETIRGVRSVFFIFPPWNNVTSDQAFRDFQTRYTARFLVAAKDGGTEKGLMDSLFGHPHFLRWPSGLDKKLSVFSSLFE